MRDAVLAGTDGLTTDVQDNSDLRTLELQEDTARGARWLFENGFITKETNT